MRRYDPHHRLLAVALAGGPRLDWVPYLSLWLGLTSGAAAGAWLYPLLGMDALRVAMVGALLLLAGAIVIGSAYAEPVVSGGDRPSRP